ncbi:MAG: hypothetical protein K2F99_09725, partial [Muribaculaceae bacterium]|nr:hypothetical protein [Muribaculaceae bacterium]
MKLKPQNLLPDEYAKYLAIGEVDESQNWLELFTPTLVEDLFTILDSSSNNQDKSDLIQKELEYYGFEPVGLGTNVYAVSNPAYPGVVFKIALDSCGLADNFNDATLCNLVNTYLGEKKFTRVFARHPSGIVTVQERKVLMRSQDRLDPFRKDILKTLDRLSDAFIIVDLSPSEFHFNYGIERNGDWCFIDASDIYPLKSLKQKITCKMTQSDPRRPGRVITCGGNLKYTEDFSAVYCEDCGRTYIPADIRPKEKKGVARMVNVMTDGMSLEEIEAMTNEELTAINHELRPTPKPAPVV